MPLFIFKMHRNVAQVQLYFLFTHGITFIIKNLLKPSQFLWGNIMMSMSFEMSSIIFKKIPSQKRLSILTQSSQISNLFLKSVATLILFYFSILVIL